MVAGVACQAARAGQITRVEPPFWWIGFQSTELQLLVYGNAIGDYTASLHYPGVSISRIERVASANYLFLYLDISARTKPGILNIEFSSNGDRLVYEYELLEKNPDPAYAAGFTPADAIYLITPDRYANGEPANDNIAGLSDTLDRTDPSGRHGGDLRGIELHLDYIDAMGFTAIWLNPLLENAMPEASYHGYATTDFYAVDPRYGSNDDYRALAANARSRGIGIIMDMIVNHCGSEHWWMKDPPAPDWINFPNVFTQTSHANATNQDPYASEFDRELLSSGWYVPAMPDLNQRNALLADYLIQNSIWWIEYIGLAGIRMDTYRYSDKSFMSEWSRRVMQEYPNLNITGEDTSLNPAVVAYWQRGKVNHDGYVSHLPSLLDFPLRNAFFSSISEEVAWWASPWTSVYDMLGSDFVYADPSNLVIFADNHDMNRIYTQLDEDDELFEMAMVFYLTIRGIPQIYYGTEVLMKNPGDENHGIIRSEFPGGWNDHEKNAFTGRGLTDREIHAQTFMKKLLHWRKTSTVIHTGRLMQFTPIKNVYAYFRYDDDATVMVVLNRGEEVVALEMERFVERLGDSQFAQNIVTGERISIESAITIEPRSSMILEIE